MASLQMLLWERSRFDLMYKDLLRTIQDKLEEHGLRRIADAPRDLQHDLLEMAAQLQDLEKDLDELDVQIMYAEAEERYMD